ncbi:hypothetical protein FOCC_FOCC015731 [Frankliniella occidentalis]|nr:hypothetical protein FOCC_FOCC015731 [Frankliniella occidentalis]
MSINPIDVVHWITDEFPAADRSTYPRWYITNVSALGPSTAARILKAVHVVHGYLRLHLLNKWDRPEIIRIQQDAVTKIADTLGTVSAVSPDLVLALRQVNAPTGTDHVKISLRTLFRLAGSEQFETATLFFEAAVKEWKLVEQAKRDREAELAARLARFLKIQHEETGEMASSACLNAVENFTGESQEYGVDEFVSAMETCFSCMPPSLNAEGHPVELTDANKCNLMRLKLRGPARAFVNSSAELPLLADFAEFKRILIARFHPVESMVTLQKRLRSCLQRDGESVQAFLARVRLAAKAISEKQGPAATAEQNLFKKASLEREVLSQFLYGLQSDIRRFTAARNPSTIEEALEYATEESLASLDEQNYRREGSGRVAGAFDVGNPPNTAPVAAVGQGAAGPSRAVYGFVLDIQKQRLESKQLKIKAKLIQIKSAQSRYQIDGMSWDPSVEALVGVDNANPPLRIYVENLPGRPEKKVRFQDELDGLHSVRLLVVTKPHPESASDKRVVADFRNLNVALKHKIYARLPGVTEIMDTLLGSTVFTSLDLHSSFHLLQVHPDDRKYLAVSPPCPELPYNRYEYCVAPMGLEQGAIGMLLRHGQLLQQVNRMSDVASSLHALQKSKTWYWSGKENAAYLTLIDLLNTVVLTPYSLNLPLRLTTDASPIGAGAVIAHVINGEERPIAYASKTFTSAEQGYSQIEREAAAVVMALKKFQHFLCGRPFELVTDNAGLIALLSPKYQRNSVAIGRIQRWYLMMSNFQYTLVQKKSSQIPHADCLSRIPCEDNWSIESEENYISFVDYIPISAADIKIHTSKDPILARVSAFRKVRGFLSELNPLTHLSNRIQSQQEKIKNLNQNERRFKPGDKVWVRVEVEKQMIYKPASIVKKSPACDCRFV